jgi:hypothetical protein
MLALLVVLSCSVAQALAAPGAALTEHRVDRMLSERAWADLRIPLTVLCVGLLPGEDGRSPRHVCRLEGFARPPTVDAADWRALSARWRTEGAAVERGDTAAFRRLLGLPPNADDTRMADAQRRLGLDRTRLWHLDVAVRGGARLATAPTTQAVFWQHSLARANLRSAVTEIEAFAAANRGRGYLGMSARALRALDVALPASVDVLFASVEGYCVTSRDGAARWFKDGQDGPVTTRPCRRP